VRVAGGAHSVSLRARIVVMFCPTCGVEYRPGFKRCSDCHVELVESPRPLVAPRAAVRAPALAYGLPVMFCVFVLFLFFARPRSITGPYAVLPLLAIIAAGDCGTLWMLYACIRYEPKPARYALLAFVPYSFFWYYFVRFENRPRAATHEPEPVTQTPRAHRARWYATVVLANALAGILAFATIHSQTAFLIAPLFLLSLAGELGMFWMMYQAIRFERTPLRYFLLAFLPFSFIWYYVARTNAGTLERVPIGLQIAGPGA